MFKIFLYIFLLKIAIRNFPKCNHLQLFSVIVVAEVESTSKNSNNPFFIRKQPGKKRNLLERKDSTEKKNDIPFITGTKSLKATPVKIFLSAMWLHAFIELEIELNEHVPRERQRTHTTWMNFCVEEKKVTSVKLFH